MPFGARLRTPELRIYITHPERTERTRSTQYVNDQGQHGPLVGELRSEATGTRMDQRESSQSEEQGCRRTVRVHKGNVRGGN